MTTSDTRGLRRAVGCFAAHAAIAAILLVAPGAAQAQPTDPLLTAAQLEALVRPLAGVPQQMLPAVLDATRYPADIMDAQQSLSRTPPEIKPTWNTGVQFLARYAPDVLGVLSRDIGTTAALGEAYSRQPNDVLRAYGTVETRSRPPTHTATRSPPPRPPPAPVASAAPAAPQGPPCQPRSTSMGGAGGGAASGAARGAMLGEFAGDPARHAAIGGIAGAIRRAVQRREREAQAANANTCN